MDESAFMFLSMFTLIYTYFFSLFIKGVFLFVWPYIELRLNMELYAYKNYQPICGTLSGVKLHMSEAYLLAWLEFNEEGRHFKREFEQNREACNVPFPRIEAALFWPSMAHTRVFEKRTGFMSLELSPTLVREHDATAWVESITYARDVNPIQQKQFESSLNLFYALDAKPSLGNHRKEIYWTARGSNEQVVIECVSTKTSPPMSCHQRWVNDEVGSIVSVGYEPVFKKHWKQIKVDVDVFIKNLQTKD
ncbi:hypothetical protein SB766_18020 [Pseudomonas sp. SIMBA_077]